MAVCIAGMHRSGTSMITRLLSSCGLYLGSQDDLLLPQRDNPDGYWENQKFVQLNDTLLEELGAGWDCPPSPSAWKDTARLASCFRKGRLLLREFEGHEPWGWKDPRNSLTLPFWTKLLPLQKVVICVRNPLEVALSLRIRNYFSYPQSLTLWTSYNRLLLDQIPAANRVTTCYERYFTDPVGELRRILESLAMPASEEMIEEACIVPKAELRHHRLTDVDLAEAGISDEVMELYVRLRAEADWPPKGVRKSRRERTKEMKKPNKGAPAAIGRVQAAVLEAMVLRQQYRQKEAAYDKLQQDFHQEVQWRDTGLRDLRAQLDEQSAASARMADTLAAREETIRELQARVQHETAAGEQLGRKLAQVDALGAEVHALRQCLERQAAIPASLQQGFDQEMLKRDLAIRDLQARLDQQSAVAEACEQTIRGLQARADDEDAIRERMGRKLSQVDALEAELRGLQDKLAGERQQIGPAPEALPEMNVDTSVPQAICSCIGPDAYQQLVQRIRNVVGQSLPSEATVLVVSRGDNQLLRLSGWTTWHFPQTPDGTYAGYYPADGREAIAHLEELRVKGGQFLLFPCTAYWWLDHYIEFRQHLESRYETIVDGEDTCRIYSLRAARDVLSVSEWKVP